MMIALFSERNLLHATRGVPPSMDRGHGSLQIVFDPVTYLKEENPKVR